MEEPAKEKCENESGDDCDDEFGNVHRFEAAVSC
jgi:hypothetical protein